MTHDQLIAHVYQKRRERHERAHPPLRVLPQFIHGEVVHDGNYTLVAITVAQKGPSGSGIERTHVGIAKRNPCDEPDASIGVALAAARAARNALDQRCEIGAMPF